MCTVVFAWQALPETPIAVAANRDERLERPSSPPEVRGSDPAVLAPRDERAGGTWMGVNEYGVFVGLTNRWVDDELVDERSRGLLVSDLLESADAGSAMAAAIDAVETNSYDGFNLLVADADDAYLLEYDGSVTTQRLDPGVHVLVNTGADGEYDYPEHRESYARTQGENANNVRAALHPLPGERTRAWLDRAEGVLGDHTFGVCIHGEGYGTVSASLVAIDETGAITYRFADGPPCRTEARSVDNQL